MRLCVLGASHCSAARQTAATRRRKRRKDVRDHAAAVCIFDFVLVVGDRRHGAQRASDPAGRPGARPAQPERHVPRGGGVDGGHPAHTGGGCGTGLRHILFILIWAVLGLFQWRELQ